MKKDLKKILLIPMCGIGKRFLEEGFVDHKSMIKIDFEIMLERLVYEFENIETFLITSKSVFEIIKRSSIWKEKASLFNMIFIEEHKLGPAYSIFKAYDQIPKGRQTFISYCDITWSWKDLTFPNIVETKAAIFCHYGFHPHLVKDNYSAFCKAKEKENNRLLKIKEKESFTDNWMEEPLSIGLFFVNRIEIIYKALKIMIDNEEKVSNEYFPSLIFNYLIQEGINVELIPVESFVHYGTPKQLNDFNRWIEYFRKICENDFLKDRKNYYPATIFTSGKGSRMKSISNKSKALIDIKDKKMIDMVWQMLPIRDKEISIIYNLINTPIDSLPSSTNYLKISKTNSQFESLFLSREHLKKQKNFFLCSCDCFGFFDEFLFSKIIKNEKFDIICFGFEPSLLQQKLGSSFSTFTYSCNKVENIYVKKIPKKNNKGLAGFFWIRDGSIISDSLLSLNNRDNKYNREIIIDDVLKYLINKKFSIGCLPLYQYIHLGSPEELKEYNYWDCKIFDLLKHGK